MTCRICKGTGIVTEVLSVYGEPQDYEPVDCPQCNGTGMAEPDDDLPADELAALEAEAGWGAFG